MKDIAIIAGPDGYIFYNKNAKLYELAGNHTQ